MNMIQYTQDKRDKNTVEELEHLLARYSMEPMLSVSIIDAIYRLRYAGSLALDEAFNLCNLGGISEYRAILYNTHQAIEAILQGVHTQLRDPLFVLLKHERIRLDHFLERAYDLKCIIDTLRYITEDGCDSDTLAYYHKQMEVCYTACNFPFHIALATLPEYDTITRNMGEITQCYWVIKRHRTIREKLDAIVENYKNSGMPEE